MQGARMPKKPTSLRNGILLATLLTGIQMLTDTHNQSESKTIKSNRQAVKCLECYQKSRAYGEIRMYLNQDHVRLEQLSGDIVTICGAPDWKIYTLHPRERSYSISDSSQNSGLIMQRYMLLEGGDLSKVKWKTTEEALIAKQKALRQIDSTCKPSPSADQEKGKGYESLHDDLRERGFWIARDIKINPRLADVIAYYHGLPKTGKLPLRFYHRTEYKERHVILETFTVKPTTQDISLFAVPKDFKLTRSEFDTSVKDNDLSEFFKTGNEKNSRPKGGNGPERNRSRPLP